VWRNYLPQHTWGIYDGNNGKETSLVDLSRPGEPRRFMLRGRSVSTLFIDGRYDQHTLQYRDFAPPFSIVNPVHLINPNGRNVNRYIDSRTFTLGDFMIDPQTQFSYGEIDPNTLEFVNYRRAIYYSRDGEFVSPWPPLVINGRADQPYRRLDGTTPRVETRRINGRTVNVGLANRSDGRIHGDFLEVWNETNAPSQYYIGLPKLHNFMRVKDENFFGVTPGALGLWAD
jgi:hypothetical protein